MISIEDTDPLFVVMTIAGRRIHIFGGHELSISLNPNEPERRKSVMLRRECGLYAPRGFGISARSGSTGSTYGERGSDRFFTIALMLWRPYELRFAWKDLSDVER